MHKKTKFLISLLIIFTFITFFQSNSAKYVIEEINLVAKLNIDRCKPNIELVDITTSNISYPSYANQSHIITGHIKITEKNIVRNDLSPNNIKVRIASNLIVPEFKSFSLLSENSTEKIYEFSFTRTTGDGSLIITIPEGIVEDKSGLINESKSFSTGITIDNTPPTVTFTETASSDNKSKATISSNEAIQAISGWNISADSTILSKDFPNTISYALPIADFAQNSSELLINIQNANNIILQYGTYDDYSAQTVVSSGNISAPNTISSNSICKSEVILIRASSNVSLQGKAYVYTHWGYGARGVCRYSELSYYHGYNPSDSEWLNIGTTNQLMFNRKYFYTIRWQRLKCCKCNFFQYKNSYLN